MAVDSPSSLNVEGANVADDRSLARLSWRCRRGMLENDLVLSRFLSRRAGTLTEEEMSALGDLLDLSDNDLWEVISGHAEPSDCRLAPLVAQLRAA
jgi:antitoxin CptB